MPKDFTGLLDYLDRRLGSHSGSGPEYQYFCPFCIDRMGDESDHRKLWVNTTKGMAVCYRCQYGARTLMSLFRAMNGGRLRMEELRIIKGTRTPPKMSVAAELIQLFYAPDEEEEEPSAVYLPPEYKPLADAFEDPPLPMRNGVNYLKGRGISPAKAAVFKMGYCPTGEYAGYVVFPVFQGGKQVYFTTRYAGKVGKNDLKCKNPKNRVGYHTRDTCLLNFDGALGAPIVAVVEGGFDVTAHKAAIGLMGKTLSESQVRLIEVLAENGTEEFVVSLDKDAGRRAEGIFRTLHGRVPKVSMLSLKEGDPYDNRAQLPTLMAGRTRTLGIKDRVKLRFSGDAGKKRRKGLDRKGRLRHDTSRNQRGR
jgi:hypothetical protein